MRRTGRSSLGTLGGLALLLASCSGSPHVFVEGTDSEFPRLQFEDGAVSMNDRCPVTLKPLSRRWDPVHVNGRSIGFC